MSTAATSTTMKDFTVIQKLGEGSFSSVFKVKRLSDGLEYALKKVKIAALSEKEKENALNEVRILASINDPNIVGYKEAFFEDSPLTLCIVMEHAGGGDFYQKILEHQKKGTHFSEKEIWKYFTQMVKGLKTLHDMNILHRDLKCANVFLSTDKTAVKLGDLNVSKVAKSALVYTQTGTPYYASPEVWSDKPYDKKSDLWSLGCIIYEMCKLQPPFRAPDMRGLYNKVVKGIYDKIPAQYSGDLSNAIAACLKVNPSVRPSVDELLNMPEFLRNARDELAPMSKKSSRGALLNTIKLPKNIRAVMLPKANYDSADENEKDGESRRESLLPPITRTPGRSPPRTRADGSKPRAMSGKESTRQASLDVNAYRHESRGGAMPPRPVGPTSAVGVRASHDLPPTRPPLHPYDREEQKGPSVMAPKPPMPGKPNYERINSGREREEARKKADLIARANNILQPTDPVIATNAANNYVNKNMNYVAATPAMPEARRASPGPNYKAAYPNWWG